MSYDDSVQSSLKITIANTSIADLVPLGHGVWPPMQSVEVQFELRNIFSRSLNPPRLVHMQASVAVVNNCGGEDRCAVTRGISGLSCPFIPYKMEDMYY